MIINKTTILLLICLSFLVQGCASAMYGYTQRKAMDRYLFVDKATENFGYKRMQYNLGHNSSLKGFIESHGLPDFIYEYENNKGRDSIKLFYLKKDIVYIYESQSWLANSLYLKEFRPLTQYEKDTYEQLSNKRL